MLAVVDDRNQQYRMAAGETLLIALQSDLDEGASITFDKVCLVTGDADTRIGTPYVDGATVQATVTRQEVKGPKLVVAKYRRRKNSRRRTGFRARFTEIRVESVNAG
ncbi:MAG: 50S ribosomal protein L21 [Planctomycetota bacterium]